MTKPMTCSAAAAALAATLGLAACETSGGGGQPAFYRPLASPSAQVDQEAARATISAYRLNRGLKALTLDPALSAAAQAEARQMAAVDRPASADAVKARLAKEGTRASVNVSAGYRTLAEAFSGWRESAQHDRTMLDPAGGRIGIATAYAPGSKYQVYWVLVVAP